MLEEKWETELQQALMYLHRAEIELLQLATRNVVEANHVAVGSIIERVGKLHDITYKVDQLLDY